MQTIRKIILRIRLIRKTASKIYRLLIKTQGIVGQQMLVFAPARAEMIRQEDFSFTMGRKRTLLDSFLWAGLVRQATAQDNVTTLESYHYDFWKGKRGYQYHHRYKKRFSEIFLQHYGYIMDEIASMVQSDPQYTTLCEIGSGSGQLLDYLESNLPQIDRFIGIDLSPETTESNRQTYPSPKLEVDNHAFDGFTSRYRWWNSCTQ